jgi:hypothetical protein
LIKNRPILSTKFPLKNPKNHLQHYQTLTFLRLDKLRTTDIAGQFFTHELNWFLEKQVINRCLSRMINSLEPELSKVHYRFSADNWVT